MNVALNAIMPAKLTETAGSTSETPVSLETMERAHIEQALSHFNWNRAKTANALGITPKTLSLKIKRYEIRVPDGD
jgi:DNA-binding NtrC family response regulator